MDCVLSLPKTTPLDATSLLDVQIKLRGDNVGETRRGLAKLVLLADEGAARWLEEGPWTVTSKRVLPPSGDIHDYMSQALYWWPSDSCNGTPYVMRDGVPNPETLRFNKADFKKVFQSSYLLSLAWYYTRKPQYAVIASSILRTWFLDPRTAMNPNLIFAQAIPGKCAGRSAGIIDLSQAYFNVLDATALLADNTYAWSPEDQKQFVEWNRHYLHWLLYSAPGIEESLRLNNHGTFITLQKAMMALYVGDCDVAAKEVDCMKRRISEVIEPDGSQPLELSRTRSWHYSCFNLVAFIRMAEVSKSIGIDLWSFDGQRLQNAVNYLIPAATREALWQHPEIDFRPYLATELIRAAAAAGGKAAQAALGKLSPPPCGDLWPLRPVPENYGAYL